METSNQMKKRAVKKASEAKKEQSGGPFAGVAEKAASKKRTEKSISADVNRLASEAAPVKKTVRKASKKIFSDPYYKAAGTSSLVKKGTAQTIKSGGKNQETSANSALPDMTAEIAADKPKVAVSPIFKLLADVALPELKRENRARLQMQTPTRLYLYWSVKENPWSLLRSVFGDDTGSYTLVLKLIDTKSGREEISQCEPDGNWWFDVEADNAYYAEIGFYAPNRPYFRILHSNTVETPRRSPSPRTAAADTDWTVSSDKFSEVLDIAGFSRDAFDVAMAGDDLLLSQNTSQRAFSSFLDNRVLEYDGITPEDIRYAMLALASGALLEELRFRVSPKLFAILQANADKLKPEKAMISLAEHFDIDESEFTEEQTGAAVFGASLINFPRTLKTRASSLKNSPRYNPVSSHGHR